VRSLLDVFARQHGLHIVGFVVIPRSARAVAAAAEKTNVTPQLAQTISSSLGCSMAFGCSFAGFVVLTRTFWAVAAKQGGMCLRWVKKRNFSVWEKIVPASPELCFATCLLRGRSSNR
jgi:hypothetical protein